LTYAARVLVTKLRKGGAAQRTQVEAHSPSMTRLETLKAETAQTVVEQRVTHHRDTQHLRAENTQLTQRCAQLERRVGALEEGAAAAGKREEKYREDADHDYFQNQTLAQGLAHYKSLNARSQQMCHPALPAPIVRTSDPERVF
jgi:uncharacterized protein YlxW (UPF0749 family)